MQITLEYLPTNLSPESINWVPLMGITVAVLAIAVAMSKWVHNPSVVAFVIMGGVIVIAGSSITMTVDARDDAERINTENLISNVKTAYDIDSMDVLTEGSYQMFEEGSSLGPKATVYKDGVAYNVRVKQNPETFAPILVSEMGSLP